jgi:DHA2 family multidrug resistance protein
MSGEQHRSSDSRSAAGNRSPWLIAVVVSIATFMVVLDTAIANVSLRYIAGSLSVSTDESTWVITTYLIANAIVLPVSGWLSNVVGRKRFYMICVATFTVASLLCGLAPSLNALLMFRILQGLGGGGMPTSEQAMLADTFPPEKRPQAFALYGIAVIVAPTVGPALGGWITDNYSWHWIFIINVPIGVLSLALVHWLVVEPDVLERERRERLARGLKIDWLGILLIATMFGSLEIVLDRGEIDGWFGSATIVTCATLAASSFIFFIPWELTRADPVINIRLLFQRQFGIAFLVMLVVGAILFGSNQITPQLMQTSFPYTAELSGFAMMPGGVAMMVMMPIAGRLTGLMQPKYWMALGFGMVAAAMWYSTSLVPYATFGFFATIRIYQTIGLPFLFLPINIVAYNELPQAETNQGSALINVARNLGGSIGVSMANTELLQRTQFHQARLVSHLYPTSPAFSSALAQMTHYFARIGSPASAHDRAIGHVGQLVTSQAAILAYIDVFYTWAVFAALYIPVVLLLVRRIEDNTAQPATMH